MTGLGRRVLTEQVEGPSYISGGTHWSIYLSPDLCFFLDTSAGVRELPGLIPLQLLSLTEV